MNAPSTYALLEQSKQTASSIPGDLRAVLGWRGLATLVLNSVSQLTSALPPRSSRSALLLTLCTYCYAAHVLASDEIEFGLTEQADLAYLTRGVNVNAADIRRFRRHNRNQIESCLAQVYSALTKLHEASEASPEEHELAAELAKKQVCLAILIDTALTD